jgi:hypothetical protein
MARIPYDPVADVAPQTQAPNDYQRIQTNPGQFGAAIGEGEEKLGAGATDLNKFWQSQQTDHVAENYLKEGNAIVQQAKTLRNGDYLNAQDGINKQLDALSDKYKSQLGSPLQQYQFDTQTRPYRDRYWAGQLSTYGDEQAHNFVSDTNASALSNATEMASTSFDNPAVLAVARAKARQSQYKEVQNQGLENNPDAVNAAAQRGDIAVFKTAAQAMGVKNPGGAIDFATQHQKELGPEYAPLVDSLRQRATKANGQRGTIDATNYATQSLTTDIRQNYNDPSLPVYAPTVATIPGGYSSPQAVATTVHIESSGNPHAVNGHPQGLAQAEPATWATYGKGSPLDPTAAIEFAQRYAAANRPILAQALGRQPTDGELYLAHQQGPGGAAKLLNNPNVPAGQLVPAKNIRVNGGNPNAPASAFTGMWTAKFGGNGVPTVTPGGGQSMTMPAAASGAPAPAQPMPEPAQPSAPAIPALPSQTVSAPPEAPQPMPTTPSPEAVLARGIQWVQANTIMTPDEKTVAVEGLRQQYSTQMLATEANAAAQKKNVEQAANEYLTGMMHG